MFLSGESPEIHGDGEQTRDFTYIKNVIHANEQALLCHNPKAFGEAYNVACGVSYSLNSVVDSIKNALLKNDANVSEIRSSHVESRVGDIRDSLADISKISSLLGYKVQNSFDEGMEEYVKNLLS